MKTTRLFALLPVLAAVAALSTGCGHGNGGPAAASLAIESAESTDIESGTLLVIKDKGTLLRVVGKDQDGKTVELDPGGITWESSNAAEVEVTPLGGSCVVKGLVDWFDTLTDPNDPASGHEPASQVTVRYDDLEATLPTGVVLNGDGHWEVKITGGTLDGIMLPLDLVQHGRTLTHETTGAMATINGRAFSIAQLGYSFEGNFSDRTTVDGLYMDSSGGQGSWTATKK